MNSPNSKREKRSLLQILIQYLKKKPVTEEEIKQLRLEAEKYRLKADIAKSKAAISGSKGGKFNLGNSPNSEDKISGLLRGAVRTRDTEFFSNSKQDLFGNSDDKEKESYRKRTLGI